MFVEHGLAQASRNQVDELIAAQDAGNVGIIENVFSPRETQSCSGDHHRESRCVAVLAVPNLPAALKSVGKQPPKFDVTIGG